MAKVVYVVALAHNNYETIGVFDSVEKMVNSIVDDLENDECWEIVVDWYCDENDIDYYALLDDEDFDWNAFNDSVKEYVKRNLKRDKTFLDEWYFIEGFYLNNETA